MRCYFMRDGHIASVEALDVRSDAEAIEKSKAFFAEHAERFESFEIWDGDRVILRHDKTGPVNLRNIDPLEF